MDEEKYPLSREPYPMLIDGVWVHSKRGQSFPVVNPNNNETIARISQAGPEEIDTAVQAARQAYDEGPWGG